MEALEQKAQAVLQEPTVLEIVPNDAEHMSHCARILLLMTHVFTSTIGDTSVVNLVNSKKAIRFIMYLLGHCLRVVRDDGRIRSLPRRLTIYG